MDYAHAWVRERVDSSVTDDIRSILGASDYTFTTSDIREELKKLGKTLAENSNPLATINALLNRLAEQGFAEETVKDGRKAWKRSSHPLHKLKFRG